MKKTCNGCRALNGRFCSLGYNTEISLLNHKGKLINEGVKPLEECPKPKTYKNLLVQLSRL